MTLQVPTILMRTPVQPHLIVSWARQRQGEVSEIAANNVSVMTQLFLQTPSPSVSDDDDKSAQQDCYATLRHLLVDLATIPDRVHDVFRVLRPFDTDFSTQFELAIEHGLCFGTWRATRHLCATLPNVLATQLHAALLHVLSLQVHLISSGAALPSGSRSGLGLG
jgi:hypothetical protein